MLASLVAFDVSAADTLYVGFLEDHAIKAFAQSGSKVGKEEREGYEPAFRVAFVKSEDGWRSVCGNPLFVRADPSACNLDKMKRAISWRGFDGWDNTLSVQTAGLRKAEYYPPVGVLKTIAPTMREDAVDRLVLYSGQEFFAARKPLALATAQFAKDDPEGWESREVRSDQVPAPVHEHMRLQLENVPVCDEKLPMQLQPIQSQIRFDLQPDRLRLRRHYQNRLGQEMWQIEILEVAARLCSPDKDASQWNSRSPLKVWVYRDRNGKLDMLLSSKARNGRDAFDKYELIEHRDFDGDGRTELIFWYSGYFHDGYVLLSDGLTKIATFTFGGN